MSSSSGAARAAPTSLFAPELRAPTAAIMLTVALAAFEGLAVAAALPQVAGDLGGVGLLPWVITSFLLTSGVATVAAGAIVDAVGVSRVFRVSVTLFALGGGAAGLVGSMPLLIAARLAQGAGAGATIAVALAAVGLVFPPRLVGRAFALNSTVWGVMGVAAPALAAALLTFASWRWIFLVNLPLGAIALAAGWRTLPGAPENARRSRLDPLGLALVGLFTLSLLVAIDALGPGTVAAGAVAVVTAVVYVRRARRSAHPALRPRHLLEAPFGPLAWSISLLLAGAIGIQSYVPLYVRGARAAGPALTAWSVLFFTVGWTIGANVFARLLDRMAESSAILTGFAVSVPAGAVLAGLVFADAPLWTIFAVLLVMGVGVGGATNGALTLLRAVADDTELGRANAAHQFLRNQGFAVGSALGGAVILLIVANAVGDVETVRGLLAGETAETSARTAAALADGFTGAVVAGVAVAAAGVVPLVALRRHLAPARRARRQEREDRAVGAGAAE